MNTINAQNKSTKYFLNIKGHTHDIFSQRTGQDKTGNSVSTGPRHQCRDFPFLFVRHAY